MTDPLQHSGIRDRAAAIGLPAARPAGGFVRRLSARAHRSLPGRGVALVGALCWTFVMTSSALVGLWRHGWETPAKYETVAILFALGAAPAFPLAFFLASFVSLGRRAETAFAGMFLALSVSTAGITAGLFALDYRRYYATWHADFPSITWVFQFVFTTAGAVLQFAVLGTQLYFPIGFLALFVASFWFARRAR